MPTTRRLRIEILVDVLKAIHSDTKNGNGVTIYHVERMAAVTYTRARQIILELEEHGLVERPLRVSKKGYAFLTDVSRKVFPVLENYGLRSGG